MNKIAKVNKVEKSFPKLMKYRLHNEVYVYFKEPGVGVVVFGEKLFPEFYGVDNWNMNYFKDTDTVIQLNMRE